MKRLDFPRLKLAALMVLLIVFITAGVAGISAGVHQMLKPSPEETRAEVIKIIKEGGLQEILSDGQYDDTYLLAELKGVDLRRLMGFTRPIEISIVDKDKNILAQGAGTGLLLDRYVLTAPQLFSFLSNPLIQEALLTGEIGVEVKLQADTEQDDEWKFETIKNVMIGENVAILERGEPLIFPTPTEFPFQLGRIEDLNLKGRGDILYGIGALSLEGGKKALYVYRGAVEFTRPEEGIIVFSSSITFSDFGGPIFALRDGKPELVGLVQLGEDGKVRAIDIQTIFDEIEKAGLKINVKFIE